MDDEPEIKLTPELQKFIVDVHNKHRSKVAMGNLKYFPTATNMLEMVGNIFLLYSLLIY